MTAGIRIGLLLVVLALAGCASRPAAKEPTPHSGNGKPVISLWWKDYYFVSEYEIQIFSDGHVATSAHGMLFRNDTLKRDFGEQKSNHFISTNEVTRLVVELSKRGLHELISESIVKELLKIYVTDLMDQPEKGDSLFMLHGACVTLTINRDGKDYTVSCDNPHERLEQYASAKGLRAFVECLDLITDAKYK